MTNEKLEQCLAQALEKTAPHDVDGVLSRCEKRKGTEIPMKTKPHSLKKWMAMAACLALLLLCGGGLFLRQANAVASVVSIDVNPSIELRVNQNEKVLACVPMNDDEVSGAKEYICWACKTKEKDPTLSKTFYELSKVEMGHMDILHSGNKVDRRRKSQEQRAEQVNDGYV